MAGLLRWGKEPESKTKRQRVSFATVTERTFNSEDHAPSLSSPKERDLNLSPVHEASIPIDGAGANVYVEEENTDSVRFPDIRGLCANTPDHSACRSSFSGELNHLRPQSPRQGLVTPQRQQLQADARQNLRSVDEDSPDSFGSDDAITGQVDLLNLVDTDAAASKAPADRLAQEPRSGSLPSKSPEASEDGDTGFDLYQEYKANQAGVRKQFRPFSPRRGSPDTVDMGPVVGALKVQQALRGMEVSESQESQVPEGRKSFAGSVPVHDGAAAAVGRARFVTSLPSPVRKAGAGAPATSSPWQKVASEIYQRETPQVIAAKELLDKDKERVRNDVASAVNSARAAIESRRLSSIKPQAGLPPRGSPERSDIFVPPAWTGAYQAFNNMSYKEVPPMPGAMHPASEASTGSARAPFKASQARQQWSQAAAPEPRGKSRRSSGAGGSYSELDSSLQYSPSSGAELAGVSALCSINGLAGGALGDRFEDAMAEGNQRLEWADFLETCGVRLPCLERQHQAMAVDGPAQPLPDLGCSRLNRAVLALAQKKAEGLRKVLQELGACNETTQQSYEDELKSWNESNSLAPAAVQVMQAMHNPQQLEEVQQRVKLWHENCKDEAWLAWYEMKNRYLKADLEITREHTAALSAERATVLEACQALEDTLTKIRAAEQTLRQRSDLHRTARRLKSYGHEELEALQADSRFAMIKENQMEEALKARGQDFHRTWQRCSEAKRGNKNDDADIRTLRQRTMQLRLKGLKLERQQLARTFYISKASGSLIEFSFRVGARAILNAACAAEDSIYQIALILPKEGDKVCDPVHALAPELFSRAWDRLVRKLRLQRRVGLEAVCSTNDVHRVIHGLDYAAVIIQDQLETLRALPRARPELSWLSAVVAETAEGPVLSVAIELVFIRSHMLQPGHLGFTPLNQNLTGAGKVDSSKVVVTFDAGLEHFPAIVPWSRASVHQTFGRPGEAAAAEKQLRSCGEGTSMADALEVLARVLR